MKWEESKLTSGRRSRLEMVCDILRVISEGVDKPTRIMQLANLTWKDLLMYLEVLLRNQLVARDVQGSRVSYSLTGKGVLILDLYLKLKQESAILSLDTLSPERVSEALKVHAAGVNRAQMASFSRRIQESGLKIENNRVVGKSGETHTFNIVATARDGSKHGYVIMDEIGEQQVLALFVNQLDTDLHIHAYSKGEISPEAKKLAENYSIAVARWEEKEAKPTAQQKRQGQRQAQANTLAFEGRNLLLEVDPAGNYERIAKEFATQYKSTGHSVLVFSWRGSPVYEAVSKLTGIELFTMSSQVSYAKRGTKPNETLLPQNDQAIILDEIGKALKQKPESKPLLIFDSVSDLVVTFGFERAYDFIKNVNEIVNETDVTSVFIVKSHAHEERVTSLIRGLYSSHLLYRPSGLSVTRQMQ